MVSSRTRFSLNTIHTHSFDLRLCFPGSRSGPEFAGAEHHDPQHGTPFSVADGIAEAGAAGEMPTVSGCGELQQCPDGVRFSDIAQPVGRNRLISIDVSAEHIEYLVTCLGFTSWPSVLHIYIYIYIYIYTYIYTL